MAETILLTKLDEWFTKINALFASIYPDIIQIPTEKERLGWVCSRMIEIRRTRFAGINLRGLLTQRESLQFFPLVSLAHVFQLYEEFRDLGYSDLASVTLLLLIDYHSILVDRQIQVPYVVHSLVKSRTTPPMF